MSNETVASWVWCGSRLTTIRTVFEPAGSPPGVETAVEPAVESGTDTDFEYAMTMSLSVWWKCTDRS